MTDAFLEYLKRGGGTLPRIFHAIHKQPSISEYRRAFRKLMAWQAEGLVAMHDYDPKLDGGPIRARWKGSPRLRQIHHEERLASKAAEREAAEKQHFNFLQTLEFESRRHVLTATFADTGLSAGRYSKTTILLTNLRDESGNPLVDRLWTYSAKAWESAHVGNVVRFTGKLKFFSGYCYVAGVDAANGQPFLLTRVANVTVID